MKQLYCPWRSPYSSDKGRSKEEDTTPEECIFCTQIIADEDEKNLILKRFEHVFVLLNKFPYNAGHLLILPYDHVSDVNQLSPEARSQMMELTSKAVTILRESIGAQGINIGMNLGKISGAGIPAHIHMHVVPRFAGDTNFLATIGETKNISFDLKKLYGTLKPYFK